MPNQAADLIVVYKFLRKLVTPFERTEAFKLGIIDKDGKKLKDPKTLDEQEAYTVLDRLVFNIKKIIERLPGGKSSLSSYATALYLIREERIEELGNVFEDAPTNSGGPAVAGANDDATWKNPKNVGGRKKIRDMLRRGSKTPYPKLKVTE